MEARGHCMRFSFVAMKTAKIHWNCPLSLGILDIHSLPSSPLAPLPFHITVQQKVCSLRRSHVMAGNGIVMRTSSKIQLVQDHLKWKSVWKIRPNVSFMAAIWESNLYGNGPRYKWESRPQWREAWTSYFHPPFGTRAPKFKRNAEEAPHQRKQLAAIK